MDHLVSVILPVYNQADHIRQIVQEYEAELVRLPCAHELLLVVNGCRDDSLTVCQRLAEEYSTLRVVHSVKGGWGLAVKRGLEAARGSLLCYTNSARTNPADLLLLSLYAVAHPDTVVKANRKIRDGVGRRLGSLLYNLECRSLFDLSNWDVNGTPKVFPRAFDALMHLTRDDDLIDAEFNAICRREGYPIIEVPIFSSRRHGGKSTTTMRSAVRLYWGAYQLWRNARKAG
jgi:glycosyltransferase involved in cell wall biosynthesis